MFMSSENCTNFSIQLKMVARMVDMDALSQLFLRRFGENGRAARRSELFDLSISAWSYLVRNDFVSSLVLRTRIVCAVTN